MAHRHKKKRGLTHKEGIPDVDLSVNDRTFAGRLLAIAAEDAQANLLRDEADIAKGNVSAVEMSGYDTFCEAVKLDEENAATLDPDGIREHFRRRIFDALLNERAAEHKLDKLDPTKMRRLTDKHFAEERRTGRLSFAFSGSERTAFINEFLTIVRERAVIAERGGQLNFDEDTDEGSDNNDDDDDNDGDHHTKKKKSRGVSGSDDDDNDKNKKPVAKAADEEMIIDREDFRRCWVAARGFEPCEQVYKTIIEMHRDPENEDDFRLDIAEFLRCCTLDSTQSDTTPFTVAFATTQRTRYRALVGLIYYLPFLILFSFYFGSGKGLETGFFLHKADFDRYAVRLFGLDCEGEACTKHAVKIINYYEINNKTTFYTWLDKVVVDNLWTGDDDTAALNPIQTHMLPVGALRIHQVRVLGANITERYERYFNETEPKPTPDEWKIIRKNFDNGHNGPSLVYRDSNTGFPALFDRAANPFRKEVADRNITGNLRNAFVYSECQQNNADAVYLRGDIATYPCGGFNLEIPFNATKREAKGNVSALREFDWLDKQTRGVFVHKIMFNQNEQLYTRQILGFEVSSGGYWHFLRRSYIFYRFVLGHHGAAWITFLVIFWLYLLVYIVRYLHTLCHRVNEMSAALGRPLSSCLKTGDPILGTTVCLLKSLGASLWNDKWLLFDGVNYIFFIVSWSYRGYLWTRPMTEYPYEVTSYQYSLDEYSYTNHILAYLEAVNAILCYLKLFKFFKLFRVLGNLIETMERAALDLTGIAFTAIILLVAFALAGQIAYGPLLLDFHSFFMSLRTLLRFVIGDYDYEQWDNLRRIISPFYLFTLQVFLVVLLLNSVTAVIADTFADVLRDEFNENEIKALVDGDPSCMITFDIIARPTHSALFYELRSRIYYIVHFVNVYVLKKHETKSPVAQQVEHMKVNPEAYWDFLRDNLKIATYGTRDEAVTALLDLWELHEVLRPEFKDPRPTDKLEFSLALLHAQPRASASTLGKNRSLLTVMTQNLGHNFYICTDLFVHVPHSLLGWTRSSLILSLLKEVDSWRTEVTGKGERVKQDQGVFVDEIEKAAELSAKYLANKRLSRAPKKRQIDDEDNDPYHHHSPGSPGLPGQEGTPPPASPGVASLDASFKGANREEAQQLRTRRDEVRDRELFDLSQVAFYSGTPRKFVNKFYAALSEVEREEVAGFGEVPAEHHDGERALVFHEQEAQATDNNTDENNDENKNTNNTEANDNNNDASKSDDKKNEGSNNESDDNKNEGNNNNDDGPSTPTPPGDHVVHTEAELLKRKRQKKRDAIKAFRSDWRAWHEKAREIHGIDVPMDVRLCTKQLFFVAPRTPLDFDAPDVQRHYADALEKQVIRTFSVEWTASQKKHFRDAVEAAIAADPSKLLPPPELTAMILPGEVPADAMGEKKVRRITLALFAEIWNDVTGAPLDTSKQQHIAELAYMLYDIEPTMSGDVDQNLPVPFDDFLLYCTNSTHELADRSFHREFYNHQFDSVFNIVLLVFFIPFLALFTAVLVLGSNGWASFTSLSARNNILFEPFRAPELRTYDKIQNVRHWSTWVEANIIEKILTPEGGFSNRGWDDTNYVVGAVLVRQIRAVKEEDCGYPVRHATLDDNSTFYQQQLARYFSETCVPRWLTATRQRTDMDPPNTPNPNVLGAFKHQDCNSPGSVAARLGTYPCSGFNFNIPVGWNITFALENFRELLRHGWIDPQTRALTVEFFIHNWNNDVFARQVYIAEVSSGGAWNPSYRQDAFSPFSLETSRGTAFAYVFGFFCAALLANMVVFILSSVFSIRGHQRRMASSWRRAIYAFMVADQWWILDFANYVCFIGMVVLRIATMIQKFTNPNMVRIYNTRGFPEELRHYSEIQYSASIFEALAAWFTFSRIFYFVRLHPRLNILSQTLSKATRHIISVLILSVVILVAFAMAGYLVYGPSVRSMHSVPYAMLTLTLTVFGVDDFDNWFIQQPIFTAIYFALFTIVAVQIMWNMITSVLAKAYGDAKNERFDPRLLNKISAVDPTLLGHSWWQTFLHFPVVQEARYWLLRLLLRVRNDNRPEDGILVELSNHRTFYSFMTASTAALESGSCLQAAIAAVDLVVAIKALEAHKHEKRSNNTQWTKLLERRGRERRLRRLREGRAGQPKDGEYSIEFDTNVFDIPRLKVVQFAKEAIGDQLYPRIDFWCYRLPFDALSTAEADLVHAILDVHTVWSVEASNFYELDDDDGEEELETRLFNGMHELRNNVESFIRDGNGDGEEGA